MRIKKFSGATVKEAAELMRRELGDDAIILNTQKIAKEKMMHFAGKDGVEITAAIDEQPVKKGKADSHSASMDRFKQLLEEVKEIKSTAEPPSETMDGLRNIAQQFEKRQPKQAIDESGEFQQLRGEVEEIKAAVLHIAEQLKYSRMPSMPGCLQKAYIALTENDIDEKFAADIIQSVYAKLTEDQMEKKTEVDKIILNELSRHIRIAPPLKMRSKSKKIIALVGPTGVGKTTTIAKLAAISKLINKMSVGLISADTYRIGAIEQLRTFAGIADIPMEVVYKPKEMASALKKLRSCDIIFIDTVGRSQRVKKDIADLQKYTDAAEPDEIHLVLNASTNKKTLEEVVERYSILKPNRFILSKIDETVSIGAVFHILDNSKIPVSYITTGQTVPDDIAAADALTLAKNIYHGTKNDD